MIEDEQRDELVSAYLDNLPTPETNAEIITQLGEDFNMSPNKVKVILTQEGVFVKKEISDITASSSKAKRVSKSAVVQELKEILEQQEKPIDEELIGKMTGKAIAYIITLLK